MGLSCIRGIVEKMGEKLVITAIDIFEGLLEGSDDVSKLSGLCSVIFNMAQAASYRLLAVISPKLVSIMEPHLAHEQEEIRNWSVRVFVTLFQRQPEKSFI